MHKGFYFWWNLKLKFPAKTNKFISTTSQDFFFDFITDYLVRTLACHPGDRGSIPIGGNFFSHFFLQNIFLCINNQLFSAFWWYKPRSVEGIWILLIFSFLFAQSDSKFLCTYLWPDNGDMRPSFWFLGCVLLFYRLLLESEHFSFGWTLICQT